MSSLFHTYIFPIYSGCAHTLKGEREWFSLELPTAQKVTKVQIARRMGNGWKDGVWHQGQNIKITIGPSKSYDPNEPTCLPEIRDLTRAKGLEDYVCTDDPPPGKFVKLSKKGSLALCEVKVFAIQDSEWKEAEDKQKSGEEAKEEAEAEKARKKAEAKKKAAEAEQAKIEAEKARKIAEEARKRAEAKKKQYEKYLELKKKRKDEIKRKAAEKKAQSKKKNTKVAQDKKRDGGIGCYKIPGNKIAKYLENVDSPKS